jgi:hypothetical protein
LVAPKEEEDLTKQVAKQTLLEHLKRSCKYVEKAVKVIQKGVVFQLGGLARGSQPHTEMFNMGLNVKYGIGIGRIIWWDISIGK